MASAPAPAPIRLHRPHRAPRLLIEPRPWLFVFASNFADLFRPLAPLHISSSPGKYWPDALVANPLPWRSFLQSGMVHTAALLAIVSLSALQLQRSPQPLQDAFRGQKITYYQVSDYLPPLPAASAPARVAQKGQPELARQSIVSIPMGPDNSTQTIINPVAPQIIRHEVPLPNMVIDSPVLAMQPTAASQRSTAQLTLPQFHVTPVAPAPVARPRDLSAMKLPGTASPVGPVPTTVRDYAKLDLPRLPDSAIIQPPPSSSDVSSKLSDINIGKIDPQLASPVLPVSAQHAPLTALQPVQPAGPAPAIAASTSSARTSALNSMGRAEPAGPAPTVSSTGGVATSAAGRLIALGLHPAAPDGPVAVPGGSRGGIFAATPEGKIGAPGTPDIIATAGGSGPGGSRNLSASGSGNGSSPSSAGVSISGGTPPPAGSVVASADRHSTDRDSADRPPSTATPARDSHPARPDLRALMAAASASPLAPTRTAASGADAPSALEDRIFGEKKYYSMALNLPNLTSIGGGSWIVRFAELNDSHMKGEVTAPVATSKVDPKYPQDLIEERVEGTVILYAVIRADGRVDAVRVIQGLDDRLDRSARVALAGWHFRPGTKNGSPVDLEAVVQIPFKLKKAAY